MTYLMFIHDLDVSDNTHAKESAKSTISDEGIEKLRDNCKEKRDLAIIDLLYSTGIRVGELVNQNNVKSAHQKYMS